MLNKEQLIKKAIEIINTDIINIQNVIDTELTLLKDAPNAMQSWSDTTRSQKEDLLFELNKQLAHKKFVLGNLLAIKIEVQSTIRIGSLIKLKEGEIDQYFFIIPSNMSEKLIIDDAVIQVISPNSIVAKALYGHKIDDKVEVKVPAGVRELLILTVE